MKTVIIALNSKYIHSSLAPWYLKYACGTNCGQIEVLEFTINDDIEWILSKIYAEKPDIAAFSCYIWNIGHVLRIADNLKKVLPGTSIILGGPEVSYTPEKIMKEKQSIDFIICGEGEESFEKLLSVLKEDLNRLQNTDQSNTGQAVLDEIDGLCYRSHGNIFYDGKYCKLIDLNAISSPYRDEMLSSVKNNKIVYYEASRGCPFSCSYCISSTFEGVRYLSMDRVETELLRLIKAGVKQVKFVDRTFNCNKQRAKEIIKFVISNSKETNFHFEVAGDLFDDELIQLLSEAPEGLIQLEIGIQTVNTAALSEIRRKTDTYKVFENIKSLKQKNNVHIHLDLIAGLPYEDYSSFQQSFNTVYMLEPHQLQLGFLKMLKGSYIRSEEQIQKHQYQFREYPPYEVLCNKYISFSEMSEIKGIEEIFERYYNSGRFINSLEFIINNYFDTPFQFYRELYLFNLEHGYLDKPISAREQYTVFLKFIEYAANKLGLQDLKRNFLMEIINDLLKLDYLSTNNTGNLPEGINRMMEAGFKEKCKDFLKDENNVTKYLPDFKGINSAQILKKVRFETFNYDVTSLNYTNCNKSSLGDNISSIEKRKIIVLFDYTNQHKVTGVYRYLVPVSEILM